MNEKDDVPMARRTRARGASVELQYHPANIRRPHRAWFIGRGVAWTVLIAVSLVSAYVLVSAAFLPRAVRAWLDHREYVRAVAERSRLGERMGQLVARLDEIHGRAEALHRRVGKVYLVYGLGEEPARGKGGYPLQQPQAPDSIFRPRIQQGQALLTDTRQELQVIHSFITEIRTFEQAHEEQIHTTPSICPLRSGDFVLTSPFGYRRSPFTKARDFHAGIDLAAPVGTPVVAPADGVVVFAGRYPLRRSVGWWRYGNLVAIRHDDKFTTLYGHCQSIEVRRGEHVQQGQEIATVGTTGWSTNPHLHYEVRQRSEDGTYVPIDPRIYILDHTWGDEESHLVRSRSAPDLSAFEPLPPIIGR
jgi:murein DD-endopeptidase MepM/ murein hydrolase activator NlpD